MIALNAVIAGGLLRGFNLQIERLALLVDEGDEAAGLVLRLIAGIERPSSGKVLIDGVDPAAEPALRRDIALLGDAVLLGDDGDLAADLARLRGVELGAMPSNTFEERRAIADAIANDARAKIVLVAYPERYADGSSLARARAAVARGATVVVATRSLDGVLSLAADDRAIGVIVARGIAAAVAPAHALPWAAPVDGVRTRIVRVVVDGAAKLSAELLNDEAIAPTLALIEPITAEEVRFHTRDPRALAKAIGQRAKAGLPVRLLSVIGASATELLAR